MRTKLRLNAAAAIVLTGMIFSISCAPAAEVETAPPAELEKKAADAEAQVQRGCYVGFSEAIRIYEDLYARPAMKKKIVLPYLKALLLEAVREREVGILGHASYQKGVEIIEDNAALQQFLPFFVAADSLSPRTRGTMQDISVMDVKKVYDDVLMQQRLKDDLAVKAAADDFYAYLYVVLYTGYGYFSEKKDDLAARLLQTFSESVLMKYKNAIYPRPNRERLQELLQKEPEFYEAYHNLGEMAISEGSLLEAEGHFLKALDGLADSPQVHIYLASIYTVTEEFDKSLEYYDRTLALSPQYRDALLGKAVSLSYLGRTNDAIEVLNKNVALGFYLLGESHYWLAWNFRELKDQERAQANIEESKSRLPTNSEVFGLAGTIAFEKGELDRAEKEFQEALKFNASNTEALFGLGRLYGQKKMWKESAGYYETASLVFERNEEAIMGKIAEIKGSKLSEERKTKLLAKKEQQLKVAQATKATGFINAASNYANTGNKTKALEMASRAAEHPQFKARAEEIIKQIK